VRGVELRTDHEHFSAPIDPPRSALVRDLDAAGPLRSITATKSISPLAVFINSSFFASFMVPKDLHARTSMVLRIFRTARDCRQWVMGRI
jgi:hypothetical protein